MKRWSALLVVAMCLAAAAAGSDEPQVNFVPASKLLADIRQAPLSAANIAVINYLKSDGYAAMVARRTKPDRSELHKKQLDVWYVVEGGGTLVTGGSLVGAQETEPDELRGGAITGGQERRIAKGDIVTIAPGVPHWIKSIAGKEIIYFVVKVTPEEQ